MAKTCDWSNGALEGSNWIIQGDLVTVWTLRDFQQKMGKEFGEEIENMYILQLFSTLNS